MQRSVFIAIVIFLLISCQQGAFYERNSVIPNLAWDNSYKPEFQVDIVNTQDRYDLYFNIRHTPYYPYSSFSFVITQQQFKDSVLRSEIKLAESDGKWIGISAGNLYEQTVLLKEDFSFPDTGKFVFSITQAMRDHQLKGINDVGIKIIKK